MDESVQVVGLGLATLDVLVDELGRLGDHGVELIPVARMIERQNDRQLVWQTSSSR